MALGYLNLVLHAHLPYVRHPEYPEFLEEEWLFEAITETYLPLLDVFDGLSRDQVPWKLTLSVTPTLAGMLSDPLLQDRYEQRLGRLFELATREVERTRWEPEFHHLARMHADRFARARSAYTDCQRNPLAALLRHHESGHLELIASAATHAFLPLLMDNPAAAAVQIELGCSEHERHLGFRPRGMWLPECGFYPGLDRLLADSGVQFVVVDAHGLLLAEPRPRLGVYAPVCCPVSGVIAVGRDLDSSRQVWSRIEGYPGDPVYRDFYRDIGFDLDYDYIRPYLVGSGERTMLGIKYHRITGSGQVKLPYDPALASRRVEEHAANFVFNREKQAEWLAGSLHGLPALVTAPYDAELFGHWWFEGPAWLDQVFRLIAKSAGIIQPITVPGYIERHSLVQEAMPAYSTWGEGGYCSFWLNGSNDWIYPHLHAVSDRMVGLAKCYPAPTALQRRALNQAAREALLLQSSDWAFILTTGSHGEYASRRTRDHILNFLALEAAIMSGELDEKMLVDLESRNNIFPELDYRLFSGVSPALKGS